MTVQKDRFNDSTQLVLKLMKLVSDANQALPPYSSDTRKRDAELVKFARSESLLSSILSYSVARQKASPWLLTGSAKQVSTYSRMLHNVHKKGWRTWLSMQALAYYTTNFGFISELETNRNSSVTNIYSIDSTRCKYNTSLDNPVTYYPRTGKNIVLAHEDIIYANSIPAFEENMNYAGFCAVERALNWSRMALAINNNHLERMGFNPPKGILFGKGFTNDDWQNAVAQYVEDKENNAGGIYDGVMGLFSEITDANLELISLSSLPDAFDIVKYVETLVNGICSAFGVPPFNVWAMNSGSFGRGLEAQISNQEASRSGNLDFVGAMQEELITKVLPPSVSFNFDLSGSAIKKLINDNQGARIKQIISLYTAKAGSIISNPNDNENEENPNNENSDGNNENSDGNNEEVSRAVDKAIDEIREESGGLITRAEARTLLASENFIPYEWTKAEEEVTVSDIQVAREYALENPNFRRAAKFYGNEPIVQYLGNIDIESNYSAGRTRIDADIEHLFPNSGKIAVLWESGDEAIKRRIY